MTASTDGSAMWRIDWGLENSGRVKKKVRRTVFERGTGICNEACLFMDLGYAICERECSFDGNRSGMEGGSYHATAHMMVFLDSEEKRDGWRMQNWRKRFLP